MTVHERPAWAEANAELRAYYDTEWGRPVRDTKGVYERIVLEGFQSGLSWATILKKRKAFRTVFADFDPRTVALFGQSDVDRLVIDERIIRNRRKIEAAIKNAQATLSMAAAGEDLGEFVWSFQPADPRRYFGDELTECKESRELSKSLKERGFSFIGPVTMFALMEAIGILNHRMHATAPNT